MGYLTEPDKLEDYNTIEPKSQVIDADGNVSDEPQNPAILKPMTPLPGKVAARDTVNQLQELAYTPPPRPKYDTKNPEYLKRAAKMSRIGEGLGVLGKAAILAMGGTVPQAKVNTAPREYMNQYMSLMDRQQQMENQYNLTEWQAKQNYDRQRIADNIRDQYRKEDIDYRNERTASEEKRYQQQEAKRIEMYEDQKKRDERDYKYREDNTKIDNARADRALKLQEISTDARANRGGGSQDNYDKPVRIRFSTRKDDYEDVPQSVVALLRDEALRNAEELENDNPHLFVREADKPDDSDPTGLKVIKGGLRVKPGTDDTALAKAQILFIQKQEQQKANKNWNSAVYNMGDNIQTPFWKRTTSGQAGYEDNFEPSKTAAPEKKVSKPKTVIQNGFTYTLNETTGEYE